jgi:hypothetical protein
MEKELLGTSNAIAWAELVKGKRRIRLVLSLGGPFTGGEIVRLAEGATASLQGAGKVASQYGFATWNCGLISGAHFAFRSLHLHRREVRIHECSGRLNSSDMEAVAYASAMAISKLANHDMAGLEGWAWAAGIQSESPPRVSA